MNGWVDHKTVKIGGRFLAASEFFRDGKPVRGDDRFPDMSCIGAQHGFTAEEAERRREANKGCALRAHGVFEVAS